MRALLFASVAATAAGGQCTYAHASARWQTYKKQAALPSGYFEYRHHEGYVQEGQDLRPARLSTFEQCATSCTGDAACAGFSFQSEQEAPSATASILCFEKSSVGAFVPFAHAADEARASRSAERSCDGASMLGCLFRFECRVPGALAAILLLVLLAVFRELLSAVRGSERDRALSGGDSADPRMRAAAAAFRASMAASFAAAAARQVAHTAARAIMQAEMDKLGAMNTLRAHSMGARDKGFADVIVHRVPRLRYLMHPMLPVVPRRHLEELLDMRSAESAGEAGGMPAVGDDDGGDGDGDGTGKGVKSGEAAAIIAAANHRFRLFLGALVLLLGVLVALLTYALRSTAYAEALRSELAQEHTLLPNGTVVIPAGLNINGTNVVRGILAFTDELVPDTAAAVLMASSGFISFVLVVAEMSGNTVASPSLLRRCLAKVVDTIACCDVGMERFIVSVDFALVVGGFSYLSVGLAAGAVLGLLAALAVLHSLRVQHRTSVHTRLIATAKAAGDQAAVAKAELARHKLRFVELKLALSRCLTSRTMFIVYALAVAVALSKSPSIKYSTRDFGCSNDVLGPILPAVTDAALYEACMWFFILEYCLNVMEVALSGSLRDQLAATGTGISQRGKIRFGFELNLGKILHDLVLERHMLVRFVPVLCDICFVVAQHDQIVPSHYWSGLRIFVVIFAVTRPRPYLELVRKVWLGGSLSQLTVGTVQLPPSTKWERDGAMKGSDDLLVKLTADTTPEKKVTLVNYETVPDTNERQYHDANLQAASLQSVLQQPRGHIAHTAFFVATAMYALFLLLPSGCYTPGVNFATATRAFFCADVLYRLLNWGGLVKALMCKRNSANDVAASSPDAVWSVGTLVPALIALAIVLVDGCPCGTPFVCLARLVLWASESLIPHRSEKLPVGVRSPLAPAPAPPETPPASPPEDAAVQLTPAGKEVPSPYGQQIEAIGETPTRNHFICGLDACTFSYKLPDLAHHHEQRTAGSFVVRSEVELYKALKRHQMQFREVLMMLWEDLAAISGFRVELFLPQLIFFAPVTAEQRKKRGRFSLPSCRRARDKAQRMWLHFAPPAPKSTRVTECKPTGWISRTSTRKAGAATWWVAQLVRLVALLIALTLVVWYGLALLGIVLANFDVEFVFTPEFMLPTAEAQVKSWGLAAFAAPLIYIACLLLVGYGVASQAGRAFHEIWRPRSKQLVIECTVEEQRTDNNGSGDRSGGGDSNSSSSSSSKSAVGQCVIEAEGAADAEFTFGNPFQDPTPAAWRLIENIEAAFGREQGSQQPSRLRRTRHPRRDDLSAVICHVVPPGFGMQLDSLLGLLLLLLLVALTIVAAHALNAYVCTDLGEFKLVRGILAGLFLLCAVALLLALLKSSGRHNGKPDKLRLPRRLALLVMLLTWVFSLFWDPSACTVRCCTSDHDCDQLFAAKWCIPSPGWEAECMLAQNKTVLGSLAGICSSCNGGEFLQLSAPGRNCTPCPAGHSCTGGPATEPCASNYFAPAPGRSKCSQCPSGRNTAGATGSTACMHEPLRPGQTASPTQSPTVYPTRFPTPPPTPTPTPQPTSSPTPRPTRFPTPVPTGSPAPTPFGTNAPAPVASALHAGCGCAHNACSLWSWVAVLLAVGAVMLSFVASLLERQLRFIAIEHSVAFGNPDAMTDMFLGVGGRSFPAEAKPTAAGASPPAGQQKNGLARNARAGQVQKGKRSKVIL